MNYGLEKPKLSFLKSLGLRRLCEKFQADKLEPKADKCIFIEYPKQLGIPPISDLEAKVIEIGGIPNCYGCPMKMYLSALGSSLSG